MAPQLRPRGGGSLPASSPAPINPEASSSTVHVTPDERGRRRRAQSLPLDVERRMGGCIGSQEFLVRPEVSRVSLFPSLNMRAVSRNYHPPTPPKVTTYDRPTASFAAMSAGAAASPAAAAAATAAAVMASTASAATTREHALDLHAADMDPTEREGIEPEDMYTHVERWLPRDLAPLPRYVPPTPPPATVLRRRAALMTPTGCRNLGAEDPAADATPRGLHDLHDDDSDDGDDGDDGDDDCIDDGADDGADDSNDDDGEKEEEEVVVEEEKEVEEEQEAVVEGEEEEVEEGGENQEKGVYRESERESERELRERERGGVGPLDAVGEDDDDGGAEEAEEAEEAGWPEAGWKRAGPMLPTLDRVSSSRAALRALDANVVVGDTGKGVVHGRVSGGAKQGAVRACRGGASFRRWRQEQFDAGIAPAEPELSAGWKK
jgi:hypothetical protein